MMIALVFMISSEKTNPFLNHRAFQRFAYPPRALLIFSAEFSKMPRFPL